MEELYNRALMHAETGEVDEALRLYEGLVQNPPDSSTLRAKIYNDFGVLLYSCGEIEKGEEYITKAIFTDFLFEPSYRNLMQINAGKLKRRDYKFSVVFTTYNRLSYVKQCIDSIRKNSFFPLEIIVVCDPSDDGTENYLTEESQKGDLIAIINEEHIGITDSVNKGLIQASGDYICILNDDVFVLPGWDLSIVTAIEDDPSVGCGISLVISYGGGVVHPGVYNPYKSDSFDWVGRVPYINTTYVQGKTLEDFQEFQVARECDYGAFPVMKRECFEKVGFFDPRFRHFFADQDLGYRIQGLGYMNIYCPTSVIMHYWVSGFSEYAHLSNQKAIMDGMKFCEKWRINKDGTKISDLLRQNMLKYVEQINETLENINRMKQ